MATLQLDTAEGSRSALLGLLELSADELETVDTALMNLLCAIDLPGCESLNIQRCLGELDRLERFARDFVPRAYRKHGPQPDYGNCPFQTQMACLVTCVKLHYGARYSPQALADLEAGIEAPLTDASEVFINGLLHENAAHRFGTCSSIPVLITAVARRLGYPVYIARARQHFYCRWEGSGVRFNIEASNAKGMAVPSDQHFQELRGGIPEGHRAGFFRSLTSQEELATFLISRVCVLRDAGRLEETLFWMARLLQVAPRNSSMTLDANEIIDNMIDKRIRDARPDCPANAPVLGVDPLEIVPFSKRGHLMTIRAHRQELPGDGRVPHERLLANARQMYEDACRYDVRGSFEQRDLQRFLKRVHCPPRARHIWPDDLRIGRRFPHLAGPGEFDALRRTADRFERERRLVHAHDALRDLYILDPSDGALFERMQAMRRLPSFEDQEQAFVKKLHAMSVPSY